MRAVGQSWNKMNSFVLVDLFLLFQYGSPSLIENFTFCIGHRVRITIVYQPSIMYKFLIRGDRITPVEVDPKNEWLKFFDMLSREFQNDDCYELFVYNALKLKSHLLNSTKDKHSFSSPIDQYHTDLISINLDEPNDFIQQRAGVKEPIKSTVYPTYSHTFFKELLASTDGETRNVILYVSSLKIDLKTERALQKLYKEKQYSVIIFSSLLFAPQFDWLPVHRNLWYYLGRQMEQFNDIRNMLRNPDYIGTELFNENLENIRCRKERPVTLSFVITEGAYHDFQNGINHFKLFQLMKILRAVFVKKSVNLSLKITLLHQYRESYIYRFYNWFFGQNQIPYNFDIFNLDQLMDEYETIMIRERGCRAAGCRCETCYDITPPIPPAALKKLEEKKLKEITLVRDMVNKDSINVHVTDELGKKTSAYSLLEKKNCVKILTVDQNVEPSTNNTGGFIRTHRTDFTSNKFLNLFFTQFKREVDRICK